MERRLASLRVSSMAAEVNVSPSRFAQLFRAATGFSPARYLHCLRMERARLLLEGSFLTVKEVMTRVGVSDPSHFTRDFKRYHGLTPGAARYRNGVAPFTPFLMSHYRFLAEAADYQRPLRAANE